MKEWKSACLAPQEPIFKALEIIDKGGMQIALVVGSDNRLLGTVTDGDVRRALLAGIGLQENSQVIMNKNPITATPSESHLQIRQKMNSRQIRQIPVIDVDGKVMGIETLAEISRVSEKDQWVVVMAGGMGSRLKPFTDNCPKPLVAVGNRPILEITLENLIEQGFKNFYLAVNYKAEMIQDYFKDGSQWNANIRYLHEETQLGTAGSLSLITEKIQKPLIVMNGDLLTKTNFSQLLSFHDDQKADATMCVREYDFQVPYGVVKLEDSAITAIDEKPLQKFFVNAGIYVLSPGALNLIPKNEIFDMTTLFDLLISKKQNVVAFPVHEYWLDVGKPSDLEQAIGDFSREEL